MARAVLLLSCSLLVAGCATTATPKVSAVEAFGLHVPETKPPPREALAADEVKRGVELSPELNSALIRFSTAARAERGRAVTGSRMPSGQVKNWLAVTGAIDDFLSQPAEKTSSYDVVRARLITEAELEQDALKYGDMPPELADSVLQRVARLGHRMAQVRRLRLVLQKRPAAYAWPVEPVVVTSLFGRRLHPISMTWRHHAGVDLEAYEGQVVTAAADGVVLKADFNGAHGLQVELQHKNGTTTRYSHLSQALVEPGLILKRGAPVGLAGSTGATTGPHLHFEVWRDGNPRDPLDELGQPAPGAGSLAAM